MTPRRRYGLDLRFDCVVGIDSGSRVGGMEIMKRQVSALVLAVGMVATACGGSDDSALVAELEKANDTAARLADELATATADLSESESVAAERLAASESEIGDLEQQLQSLEEQLESAEAARVEADTERDSSQQELDRLRLAFDGELTAATERLRQVALPTACELGREIAESGLLRESLEIKVAEEAALDPLEAAQFAIVMDVALADLDLSTPYEECKDIRQAEIREERLVAEREAMASLLPAVCDYYRHNGRFLSNEGSVGRERNLSGYINSVIAPTDPYGWQSNVAVEDEAARCEALPLLVHPGGTLLVGTELAAGTYRSVDAVDDSCYWERTRPDGSIIDNQFTSSAAQITVRVRSSDYSVENDCTLLTSVPLRTQIQ